MVQYIREVTMLKKVILAGTVGSLLLACSGAEQAKNKDATPELSSVEEMISSSAEVIKIDDDEIQARELENKRKEIEDAINRIMEKDIYFGFDKHTLTAEARELLAQVGDMLIKEKQFDVVVEGHTDEQGTETYNMALGDKRATIVKDFLIQYGVTSDRMQTISYGEEKPKVSGESEEAYQKNRRAHFRVVTR